MKQIWQGLYLTNRFFILFSGVILLFVLSYPLDFLMPIALIVLVISTALVFVDGIRLFQKQVNIVASRNLPALLSLSDNNTIQLQLHNQSPLILNLSVIEELPVQFQIRDFLKQLALRPDEHQTITYDLRPLERGAYFFGNTNLFLSTTFRLLERRLIVDSAQMVPVYPSVLQMKQLELKAFDRSTTIQGLKKIRRIGHSYEFDHVKEYISGDDYRSINWKASSRQAKLMVNRYEDERAQQAYCIIDKSRNMHMPFDGLSLMDYAINSTLALSNIILKKYDRAGLMSFSDKMGSIIKADSRKGQLQKILQALYNEKERPVESNFELLYYATRKLLTGRSLLLLYTNFESMYALDRVLHILRRINATHLLVVIFFENSEIIDFTKQEAENLEDIYHKTIAKKFIAEKRAMVQKLQQYGIQAVLTKPELLSLNTLNKYLELKARGLI